MPLPVILAACTALIVCLTPLSVYLYWLVGVHRRDRPTVVAGHWDFVALACGLAGFTVYAAVAVPAAVVRLNPFAGGGFAGFWKARLAEYLAWVLVTGGFALAVGAAVARAVKGRRRTLAVYNIEPADADAVLAGAFANLGLPAGRYGNLWSADSGLVEVVPFHAFRHVTLKLLPPDPRLCEELEREIRAGVDQRPGADGPAGGWLLTAAVATTAAALGGVLLTFAAVFLR